MQDLMKDQNLTLGGLHISFHSRTATLNEVQLELTSGQFDLLSYLAKNAGCVLSRDQLYQEVRGINYNGYDSSIDLRICQLRKILNDSGRFPRRIKSVRSIGYLFSVDQ